MATALIISPFAQAAADVQAKLARCNPGAIGKAIREDLVNAVTNHLRQLDTDRPNALGGVRTNYWGKMARSVNHELTDTQLRISIGDNDAPGINLKYHGGTITPKEGKQWVTIPARSEAYGKRAREFNNLRFIPLGPETAMLVVKEGGEAGRRRVKGSKGFSNRKSTVQESLVMYWLKRSVTQPADPSVLPTSEQLGRVAITGAQNYVEGFAE